jgi:hypothetical protein
MLGKLTIGTTMLTATTATTMLQIAISMSCGCRSPEAALVLKKAYVQTARQASRHAASLADVATVLLHQELHSLRHTADELVRVWIRATCGHHALLERLEGIAIRFLLPQALLRPRPDILLWTEVGRILRPAREDIAAFATGACKSCSPSNKIW